MEHDSLPLYTFNSLETIWNPYASHYRPINRVEETNSPIGRICDQLWVSVLEIDVIVERKKVQRQMNMQNLKERLMELHEIYIPNPLLILSLNIFS